jgi:hypothetical protein
VIRAAALAAALGTLTLGAATAHAAPTQDCQPGPDVLRPLLAQPRWATLAGGGETCAVRAQTGFVQATSARLSAAPACHDRHYRLWEGGWAGGTYSYAINLHGMPGGRATAAAIVRGHEAWDRLATVCAVSAPRLVQSRYLGPTDRHYSATPDGYNVIDFGDMAGIGHSNHDSLAYTQTWWDASGHIVESDQRYNAHLRWSTDGKPGTYDVQAVATHETGHTLGIAGDYPQAEHRALTMSADMTTDDTAKRDLGLGDVLALEHLYARR